MKAIVYEKYGTPDVLQLKEVEKPVPTDSEVLIKVYAVSLNDWDVAMLDGDLVNRMMNGFSKPRIQILGSDVAGKIEAVGKHVTKFAVGDDVYGDLSGRWGGFAEYVTAPERSLALKPSSMTFEQAASIPQAAMLAVQGLIDKGEIRSGQKILINGAGGGVGTFGVQIARQFDVEVTGVDNSGKLQLMKDVGFDHVMDYTKEDFTKTGKKYDLILDAKTNRSPVKYLMALNPRGKYVTVGGDISRLLQAVLMAPILGTISKKKISIVALKPNKDLLYLNKLFEEGKVRPVIDGPYDLNDVASAFRSFREGAHRGKVVITVNK